MSEPVANTVEISKVDGTTQWTWVRHMPLHGDPDTIISTGPVPGLFFPDSASALANAKAVNADLTDEALFLAAQ